MPLPLTSASLRDQFSDLAGWNLIGCEGLRTAEYANIRVIAHDH